MGELIEWKGRAGRTRYRAVILNRPAPDGQLRCAAGQPSAFASRRHVRVFAHVMRRCCAFAARRQRGVWWSVAETELGVEFRSAVGAADTVSCSNLAYCLVSPGPVGCALAWRGDRAGVPARPRAAGGSCIEATRAFVLSQASASLNSSAFAGGLGLSGRLSAARLGGRRWTCGDLACGIGFGWIGLTLRTPAATAKKHWARIKGAKGIRTQPPTATLPGRASGPLARAAPDLAPRGGAGQASSALRRGSTG